MKAAELRQKDETGLKAEVKELQKVLTQIGRASCRERV